MSIPFLRACAVSAAVAALTLAAPATRAFEDYKAISAASCQPYAPDTTLAELAYSPTGIYNGGTTNEKVLCTLPRDQDAQYHANDLHVAAMYRVIGGTLSRMTCTLYIGSTSSNIDPVYTSTVAGPFVAGGQRAFVLLDGGPQPYDLNNIPSTMICVIPPKTSFAGIRIQEMGATQTETGT